MIVIRLLQATDDILRCFPLMADLRPHLREDEFVSRVRGQQREHGYRLAVLEEDGAVRAVAGFRIAECLAWGRFLYVDDLVTARSVRFRGYGQQLFDWLLAEARREGCEQLHLDSGVQRYEAHGFYLKNRLHITSHHFTRVL
ncbi:MAG: GNAT family N-acetyltransferase [Deltaproteobacteria bacterium]|nr:MAG: GNAT family N-acetyltransferase [Deltaproteobacteria bacterium]TMB23925.1 MAG: GNAT family N-acetyltransferase [Deltaproteobacteria bacterium]